MLFLKEFLIINILNFLGCFIFTHSFKSACVCARALASCVQVAVQNWFSPSFDFLGIKLRSTGLAASTFAHWTISLPSGYIFIYQVSKLKPSKVSKTISLANDLLQFYRDTTYNPKTSISFSL